MLSDVIVTHTHTLIQPHSCEQRNIDQWRALSLAFSVFVLSESALPVNEQSRAKKHYNAYSGALSLVVAAAFV